MLPQYDIDACSPSHSPAPDPDSRAFTSPHRAPGEPPEPTVSGRPFSMYPPIRVLLISAAAGASGLGPILQEHEFVVDRLALDSPLSGGALAEGLDAFRADVAILDLTDARSGAAMHDQLDQIRRIAVLDPGLPVVVVTALLAPNILGPAVGRGARDCIQMPSERARLIATLQAHGELARAERGRGAASMALADAPGASTVAHSEGMQRVVDAIVQMAPLDTTVPVIGEAGTGKSLVAHALHRASGRRAYPFVRISPMGMSEAAFRVGLLGDISANGGASSALSRADHGTLLVKDIARVPASVFEHVRRVCETGEYEAVGSTATNHVDVRCVVTLRVDHSGSIQWGNVPADIIPVFKSAEIRIPPLRQRHDDIPGLAMQFLAEHASNLGKTVTAFEPEAMVMLTSYAWPGNVRELYHVVERGVLLAKGDVVRAEDIAECASRPAWFDNVSLHELESALLRKAMTQHGGRVNEVSKVLGWNRQATYQRLRKHRLL
jgi:DNA-binding NtrC family response regulator